MFPRRSQHGQILSNKKPNNNGRISLLSKAICRPKFSEAVLEAIEAQRNASATPSPTPSFVNSPKYDPASPMSGSSICSTSLSGDFSTHFATNQWEAKEKWEALKSKSPAFWTDEYNPMIPGFVTGSLYTRPPSSQGFIFQGSNNQTPRITANSERAFYVVDQKKSQNYSGVWSNQHEKVDIPGGAALNAYSGLRQLLGRLSHEVGTSRHLIVLQENIGYPMKQAFQEVVTVCVQAQLQNTKSCTVEAYGNAIFMSFANIDDATRALCRIRDMRAKWLVDYATMSELELIGRSLHESQVLVSMRGAPPFTPSQKFMEKFLRDSASRCGQGYAIKPLKTFDPYHLEVFCEFSDIFDCCNFVTLMEEGQYRPGFEITVAMQSPPPNKTTQKAFPSDLAKFAHYHPSLVYPQNRRPIASIVAEETQQQSTEVDTSREALLALLGKITEAHACLKPHIPAQAISSVPVGTCSRQLPEIKKTSKKEQLALARRLQDILETGPQASSRGTAFFLDFPRIVLGQDARTTVMLKNIPNKVDQAWIKGFLDQTSRGRYDFAYLRIDFASQCNVGYAFVNFLDPMDIFHLAAQRLNQLWNVHKSSKSVELAYANVQGRGELVRKFRNSVVMREPAHYRPKLFYAEGSPTELVGTEEPFPEPGSEPRANQSRAQTTQKDTCITEPQLFRIYGNPSPASRFNRSGRSRRSGRAKRD